MSGPPSLLRLIRELSHASAQDYYDELVASATLTTAQYLQGLTGSETPTLSQLWTLGRLQHMAERPGILQRVPHVQALLAQHLDCGSNWWKLLVLGEQVFASQPVWSVLAGFQRLKLRARVYAFSADVSGLGGFRLARPSGDTTIRLGHWPPERLLRLGDAFEADDSPIQPFTSLKLVMTLEDNRRGIKGIHKVLLPCEAASHRVRLLLVDTAKPVADCNPAPDNFEDAEPDLLSADEIAAIERSLAERFSRYLEAREINVIFSGVRVEPLYERLRQQAALLSGRGCSHPGSSAHLDGQGPATVPGCQQTVRQTVKLAPGEPAARLDSAAHAKNARNRKLC